MLGGQVGTIMGGLNGDSIALGESTGGYVSYWALIFDKDFDFDSFVDFEPFVSFARSPNKFACLLGMLTVS